MFLHGALIVAMLVCVMMSRYENQLIDSIVSRTVTQDMSDRQKALALLNQTHELLKPRAALFGGSERVGIRERLFTSADVHLMDGKGACGSYAGVLTRLLQRTGIDARLAQMKCGNEWGCHINLEAKIDGEYVVLDPLYNLAFVSEEGTLANFQEVGNNWEYYKSQVPENYYPAYQYEDVRYTNWQKIPVLMPLIKSVLDFTMGAKANQISIRSYVLNIYQTYFWFIVFCYTFLLVLTIRFCIKKAQYNI